MGVPGQNIMWLLLAGLILSVLSSAIADRKALRLITDICVAGVITLAVAWLIVGGRDLIPGSHKPLSQNSTQKVSLEQGPNYEPVVLPLRPLKALLKPVVYRSPDEICDTLARAAHKNDLPVHFLIRLLYQESSFRPEAISSAGALGIAQFMPETASDRRLDNPFDPAEAIPASARLLRDLYRKFGNLGLAAAAYNAGPRRIEDWQTNKTPLPLETVDYVRLVTGFPVETWTAALSGSPALKIPSGAPCQGTVGLLASDGPNEIPLPAADPRSKVLRDTRTAQTNSIHKKISDANERRRRKLIPAEIAASDTALNRSKGYGHAQQ